MLGSIERQVTLEICHLLSRHHGGKTCIDVFISFKNFSWTIIGKTLQKGPSNFKSPIINDAPSNFWDYIPPILGRTNQKCIFKCPFIVGGLPDRDPTGQRPPWTETPPGQRPLDRDPLDIVAGGKNTCLKKHLKHLVSSSKSTVIKRNQS